jgi:hypothetical protein
MLKHEQNCLLITSRDVNGLAQAIDMIRSFAEDRRRLALRLRIDVERYPPANVCDEIANVVSIIF